jgi:hypothetical protein
MILRETLRAPQPDAVLAAELSSLATLIEISIEGGHDASHLISKVQQLTGSADYDERFFTLLHGWSSPSKWAVTAAIGRPVVTTNLTREEIVELIELASIPGPAMDFYLAALAQGLPHSDTTNLIFWPDREMTPEETADEALLRDRLAKEKGPQAVVARLTGRAHEVLSDPNSPAWAVTWAESYLSDR